MSNTVQGIQTNHITNPKGRNLHIINVVTVNNHHCFNFDHYNYPFQKGSNTLKMISVLRIHARGVFEHVFHSYIIKRLTKQTACAFLKKKMKKRTTTDYGIGCGCLVVLLFGLLYMYMFDSRFQDSTRWIGYNKYGNTENQ